MEKGKVRLPLPNFKPQLKDVPRPWTSKRFHVNDFSESGDTRSQKAHDWLEWTSKVGTTQVTPTRFILERNMDPCFDDDQYLIRNEEGGDDEMINYWSGDDSDWFLSETRRDFPNEGKDLYNMTEAMHTQEPLKKEDGLKKQKKEQQA